MDYQQISKITNELESIFNPVEGELTCNELAEILWLISEIFQGKNVVIQPHQHSVIGFILLMEKLGLIDENVRKYLLELKVTINDKEKNTNYFFFSNELEHITNLLSDSDFIDNYMPMLNKYKFDPFRLLIVD